MFLGGVGVASASVIYGDCVEVAVDCLFFIHQIRTKGTKALYNSDYRLTTRFKIKNNR